MSGAIPLFALFICAPPPPPAEEQPGDARALLKQAAERHFALRQYRVEVRTATFSGDRLHLASHVRITVDEEARAFHFHTLPGDRQQALSDGSRLWVRGAREVTETPAEGPDPRAWRQAIERNSGRFALLGRSMLDADWLKWETLKRGRARIKCGVIRIRPVDYSEGIWTEMLWISPETGLIWKSVFNERTAPPGMGMGAASGGPGSLRGGVSRNPAPVVWETVVTREYDWLHTEGELPADTFAKPAWAAKAKQR